MPWAESSLPSPSRRRLLLSSLASLAGCRPASQPAATISSRRPHIDLAQLPRQYQGHNLIFVSFDALQASHVGAWGNLRPVTPTIDALAAEGFRFARASSVASWTVPASMSWFTGVYPSEHRLTNKFAVYQADQKRLATLREMAPGLTTLTEVLKQHGYLTAGFSGNAGVSGSFGFQQGFDIYHHEKGRFGRLDQSAPRALEWLSSHRREKFFLFLHGYDVHGQCLPGSGLDYRFVEPTYDRKFLGSEREQALLREEGLEQGAVRMRPEDVRFWRAVYDEKLQRADAQFGRFLTGVDRLGLLDRTLLVVTSDHGTELYEHRRFDHGFTLYNELLHVPLVVTLPDRIVGQVIDRHVSSIDLPPTVLDLLGIPLSGAFKNQLRGRSLAPLLFGEPWQTRDIFSETDYREYTYKRAVTTPDDWKLIYTLESRQRELFDLKRDPHELHNLAEQEPARTDELQARLFAHFRAIGCDLEARAWRPGMNPVYDLSEPSQ